MNVKDIFKKPQRLMCWKHFDYAVSDLIEIILQHQVLKNSIGISGKTMRDYEEYRAERSYTYM